MIALKCDRCGALYEPYNVWDAGNSDHRAPNGVCFAQLNRKSTEYRRGMPPNENGTMVDDLCPACMESLLEWWGKENPQTQDENKEEPPCTTESF